MQRTFGCVAPSGSSVRSWPDLAVSSLVIIPREARRGGLGAPHVTPPGCALVLCAHSLVNGREWHAGLVNAMHLCNTWPLSRFCNKWWATAADRSARGPKCVSLQSGQVLSLRGLGFVGRNGSYLYDENSKLCCSGDVRLERNVSVNELTSKILYSFR